MGKLAIFIFAAWAGLQAGGVVVGLIACGVVLAACSAGTHLMQDFRTGFYTMAAPRAMFASQVAGAATGALLAPLTFLLFWNTGQVRAWSAWGRWALLMVTNTAVRRSAVVAM